MEDVALLVGLAAAGPAIAAAAGAARPVVPLAALAGGPVVLWARRHGRSRATPPSTLTESR